MKGWKLFSRQDCLPCSNSTKFPQETSGQLSPPTTGHSAVRKTKPCVIQLI